MSATLRIGTRDSQLAMWQATRVQELLSRQGITAELVPVKSEGDIDLQTPLYAMGVQGVFTRALDIALLQQQIDLAVHSMKDVPTQLAQGIVQAAVLERASHLDIFVHKGDTGFWDDPDSVAVIATSSIRRKAQWLNRYPGHTIENLRGNVNTRLRKVQENNWQGAIFAAAGLERIGLRPAHAIDLDWMLPAPAQGAIMVVCRAGDSQVTQSCSPLNDPDTELCTRIERDFLQALSGGCSTPISALAKIAGDQVFFTGNILSPDGRQKAEVQLQASRKDAAALGMMAAPQLLSAGGQVILENLRNAKS